MPILVDPVASHAGTNANGTSNGTDLNGQHTNGSVSWANGGSLNGHDTATTNGHHPVGAHHANGASTNGANGAGHGGMAPIAICGMGKLRSR